MSAEVIVIVLTVPLLAMVTGFWLGERRERKRAEESSEALRGCLDLMQVMHRRQKHRADAAIMVLRKYGFEKEVES